MTDPYIIMSAPNGARRQKTDHPLLPITPGELADCAREIRDAGASIIHLHVRDEHNQHSLDVDCYRAAIAAIRVAVGDDLIIQVTSEAVGQYSRFEQMQMVRVLKPEAVSLALREICPKDDDLTETTQFINWMKAEKIFPQYILYDVADLARFERYRQKGVFASDTPFVLFVLGRYPANASKTGGEASSLMEQSKAVNFPWAVCGFGANESDAIVHAAQCNGHIRVGFENNIYQKNNKLLGSHEETVKLAVNIAYKANRAIATPNDVRNMLFGGL